MGNIILETHGTDGDIFPFIRIGRDLKTRGHRVTLFTHSYYEKATREAGLEFVPVDTLVEYERFIKDNSIALNPLVFIQRHIMPNLAANYRLMESHCNRKDTVLVFRFSPGIIPRLVSEKLGIPKIAVFLAPSFIISDSFVQILDNSISEQLQRIRAEIGLPSQYEWQSWWKAADENIGYWSEWFANDPDWPIPVKPLGFVTDTNKASQLPEEIHQILRDNHLPVVINGTSGTYFAKNDFYNVSIEACRMLGATGILVARYKEFIPEPLPQGIHWFSHLPFSLLLPKVKAIIHHGGIGTAAQALAAGIPQLVLPLGADRPDNAARLKALGVGDYLLPPKWESQTVAWTLQEVLNSGQVMQTCSEIAARMQDEDVFTATCDMVENLIGKGAVGTEKRSSVRRSPQDNKDTMDEPSTVSQKATGKELVKLVEALPQHRLELLAQLLRKEPAVIKPDSIPAGSSIPRLPRAGREYNFPLSFTQERLWFLQYFDPESTIYNGGAAFRLSGPLDTAALKQALQAIITRHESLRTVFREVDGKPYQVIVPDIPWDIPVIDLQAQVAEEREAAAERIMSAEKYKPYDLANGPLIRTLLIKLGENEALFFLGIHHIVADGWGVNIFVQELTALYEAFAAGVKPSLPELPVQYADFAVWQREWLRGSEMEAKLAYWKNQLQGGPALVSLPTDFPRPAAQTFRGADRMFTIPAATTGGLKKLSREHGATLFMTLLSAFKVLIQRYTHQTDIVIGTPIANRTRRELEDIIGCFMNTLAIRTDLSGNPSFVKLLERVKPGASAAFVHQDVPFERIVDVLQPERNLSHPPIFQIMFVLQNTPRRETSFSGVQFDWLTVRNRVSQFDLSLYIGEYSPGELSCTFEYNTDLFRDETIRQLVKHFNVLLEGIVADPTVKIEHLPLITPDERRQLLYEWNQTKAEIPPAHGMFQLFEEQARLTPDAIALVQGKTSLTYQELNQKANQLARDLQKMGVGKGVLVGVFLERSLEMVAGLLGILKAGGCYVPMDIKTPADRIRYIIEDSGVSCLITQESLIPKLPGDSLTTITLDGRQAMISREDNENPMSMVSSGDPVYVIYTSGSTGKPKGVMICHKALVNFLCSMRHEPGFTQNDTMLAVTTLSFDIAGLELYLPLVTGGKAVIATNEEAGDPYRLMSLLRTAGITMMQATPATWKILIDAGWEGDSKLKVLCGGEALSKDLAGKLLSRVGELWNMYGPTETTIWSGACRVRPEDPVISIGKPIANTTFYILDSAMQPVPVGVAGELFIGGDGLALGYHKRPELTLEKFIPDPYGAEPEACLYRTGDLVRYLLDGSIEFLGRLDFQVKIRGFRIELGEIESVLEQHPLVKHVVVTVFDAGQGRKSLVAYLVYNSTETPGTNELRLYLRERLPDYMVPSYFVKLDAMPLSQSGKIDRKSLPKPDADQPDIETPYTPPRNITEQTLACIWETVLGVKQAGIHDNFFQLGGDSILSIQIIAKAGQAGIHITPKQIFEYQTIAELAAVCESVSPGESIQLPVVAPQPQERYQPFPLTDIQEAYWIGRTNVFELGNVAACGYFEFESNTLEISRFGRAFQRLIDRHDMMRVIVLPDGRQQVLDNLPSYQIEILDLRGTDPESKEKQLMAVRERMSTQIIPSERWPLFEIRLSRLDDRWVRVHISLDVIIVDAWSIQTLAQELYQFYQNPNLVLPRLEITFRDYVTTVAKIKETDLYRRSREYWLKRLPELPPAPDLPLAKDPAMITKPKFVRRRSMLEPETWRQLKKRAAEADLTPSGIVLATFAEVLTAWSKNPQLTLNITLFNRLPVHPQVNMLIGDFTSLTLLAVDNGTPGSIAARAGRIQDQLLEDIEHRYFGGVEVLREITRMQQGKSGVLMPVVFTSTLNMKPSKDAEPITWLDNFIYSSSQTPQVWLDYQVSEDAGSLAINWDVIEELFPPGLVDEMFKAYNSLLHRLAQDEDIWSAEMVSLIPARQLEERSQINQTAAAEYGQLLQVLFEERAARQPDTTAVVSSKGNLSYGQLAKISRRLGHWLRSQGARPNQLVAVVMEKGWEQVSAVMGILQSGAAYLPIDPGLPMERIRLLLADGDVRIVLTQSWINQRLEWPNEPQRFNVDQVEAMDASDEPLAPVQTRDDLAYVIYTSGSTGSPKGVMIDHRGAVNTILDINQRFRVGAEDRVLALSALNFDLSVYDIFGILTAGGTIVMPDAGTNRDPGHWTDMIQRHRVTLWNSVPALMEMLVEYSDGQPEIDLTSFRLVMMSGDWIPLALPDRIKAKIPGVEVISLGGATEASIWSIIYPIVEVDRSWPSIPYGKPMVNQGFHVLNYVLEPCPVWVPGELYISGIGLAKGYWHDEAKTRERFIIHPRTGERLYKTGDLGRFLPDGNIEFMGRVDFQVKIQGHRIELGEIETALMQFPNVKACVVSAVGQTKTDKRLVAYVVPDAPQSDESPSEQKLREFLRGKLPEYMVPAAFVMLESLPLSANGKVDRKALPVPEIQVSEAEKGYAEPGNDQERLVAAIWKEVLQSDNIGVHDNFFGAGGTSIHVVRVHNKLKEATGKDIPIGKLFEYPTIRTLAEYLTEEQDQLGQDVQLPVVTPDLQSRFQPFPLTDVQQAYWVGRTNTFELGNVAACAYTEFESDALDVARFNQAFQRLIDRHDMLRAIVLPDGRQQVLKNVPTYEIDITDLRGVALDVREERLKTIRERMANQVMPSDRWPLFEIRASLLDNRRVRIHISVDILIVDAWSIQILLQELYQLYQETETGLPPLEITFRDYIMTVNQIKETGLYRRSLEYWQKRLANLPPAPELPLVMDPASIVKPKFVRHQLKLEPGIWQRLKNRAAESELTPSGIILAVFAEVLTAWSKVPEFTLNITLFNRLPVHPQVNMLVGDFTSLTLLAINNTVPGTFEARASRIQNQLWDDIAHRYVSGIEVLRELARMQKGMSGALMPVVFTSILNMKPGENTESIRWVDEIVYSSSQTPQVWLDHQVIEEAGTMMISWDVIEELFPPGLVDEMFNAYNQLLHRLAHDEEIWVAEAVSLIPARQLEERSQINQTAAPESVQLLQELFEEQAARQPEATAVAFSKGNLSYGRLVKISRRLGRWLRSRGVRPNQLVAVVMEKGWEQVAAVMGILQSGAAYLPIDPGLPMERIRLLLADGDVRIVLTQSWIDQRLEWPKDLQRFHVDQVDAMDAMDASDEPLAPVQTRDDLAYVIYTSGSTGSPKGVMIDHRGAVNTILDINQRFRVGAGDRVLALSALNFDLSVYDIFGILTAGGTIVVPDPGANRDPGHWADMIQRHRVTLWNSVPALMEMLVEYSDGQPEIDLTSFRLVMMSGDWIPLALPDRIKAKVPVVDVFSLGGATEASIWSIIYPIAEVDPSWPSIPYGKPMVNQGFHVLSHMLEPCPVWVPGELYISGIGLAKGYWHDEAKTRERFIIHPRTGERLYKTGDLGRFLPDGNIEFMGRVDFQVKIQGHRIELGEIETALMQFSNVKACVVSAVGQSSRDKRLVAYVVPENRGAVQREKPAQKGLYDTEPSSGSTVQIIDPTERLRYKMKKPALRKDQGDRSVIPLKEPDFTEEQLKQYLKRRSFRKFLKPPIPFEKFSGFLSCLRPVTLEGYPLPKYRYGSAGGIYPVQTYIYVKPDKVEGLAAGIYYYQPYKHSLMALNTGDPLAGAAAAALGNPLLASAAFAIFLVAQMNAITPLYGEKARGFCFFEAGIMSQLLESAAPEYQLGLCQLGGLDFEPIRSWFDLDSGHEYLHCLLGGGVSPEQLTLPGLVEDSRELREFMDMMPATPEDAVASTIEEQGLQPQIESKVPMDKELREYLRRKLPEYMVPSTFIMLEAIPLSANGKVDRKALPAPETQMVEAEKGFVVPQTETEYMIAGIWKEVLQLEKLGVHDNFFGIGGTSVHIVRVHNQLKETSGKEIPIVKLFEYPTIHSLAQYLTEAQDHHQSLEQSEDRATTRKELSQQNRQNRQRRTAARGGASNGKGDHNE